MSSKARRSGGVHQLREEGSVGAFDGRTKGGHKADGHPVPKGVQGREGAGAGRTVHPDRMDPPPRPAGAGPSRGPAGSTTGSSLDTTAQDLRPRGPGAAQGGVGHPERPRRQAPGPVHGRDRAVPGAIRRARGRPGGPGQAGLDLRGHHRPDALTRAAPAEGQGTLGDQAGIDPQAPDPHPDLRRVGRGDPRVLRGRPGGTRRRFSVGEFCQTLDLTCVNTGWTEMRALPNKAQRWCFEALQDIEASLPFPLGGLDCDNGSEFINVQLFRYCGSRGITFTRSRAYRKYDLLRGAEELARRPPTGGLRPLRHPEELEALRELYGHLRYYGNFFQPQMKLVSKTRRGAKVAKRYDAARTPYRTTPGEPRSLPRSVRGHFS